MNEFDLYLSGLSIPEVSEKTEIPKSTLRFRFLNAGILRSRKDALKLSGEQGKLGGGMRGKARVFSDEHKKNLSLSRIGKGKGISVKPNGYIEYTMGEHKFRSVHVVAMEEKIGRRLYANECVHHKDEDKSNNCIENLELMTRAEHASHHAKENNKFRLRDNKGRYKNGKIT